jgi:hypothetical protein
MSTHDCGCLQPSMYLVWCRHKPKASLEQDTEITKLATYYWAHPIEIHTQGVSRLALQIGGIGRKSGA